MPIGAPIRIASSDIIRLPKNALSRPPSEPGGGVICVNSARFIAATPLTNAVSRIQTSQNRPNTVAASDKRQCDRILDARAGDRGVSIDRGHAQLPSRLARRISMYFAIASTMNVTTNSRKPSAISDER